MDQGFIKLWRKSINSIIFQDADLWKLWTWCLMKANHTERNVTIKTGRGNKVLTCKRGQFVFGRKSAARALKMKPTTVRYRMLTLSKLQNLDMQVDTHFTIVTIRNYDKYNDIKNNVDRSINNQLTGNCHPTDTNKNYKNYKNKKDMDKNKNILPNFISQKLWQDFKKHRIKLRSPMTEKSEKLNIGKIKKFSKGNSEIARALIEQSIEKGWKGIFDLKDEIQKEEKHGLKEFDFDD